jgi:hypothetical protein
MTLTREEVEAIKVFNEGDHESMSPRQWELALAHHNRDGHLFVDTTSELCTLALTAIDMRPRPIEEAPKDGAAFLAFGIHDTDNGRHWRKGDEWTCILLYDTWREVGMGGGEFVFSKDGAKPWSKPLSFIPLTALPKVQS